MFFKKKEVKNDNDDLLALWSNKHVFISNNLQITLQKANAIRKIKFIYSFSQNDRNVIGLDRSSNLIKKSLKIYQNNKTITIKI